MPIEKHMKSRIFWSKYFHIYCEMLYITAENFKCNSFFENKSDVVCTNTQNYTEMI